MKDKKLVIVLLVISVLILILLIILVSLGTTNVESTSIEVIEIKNQNVATKNGITVELSSRTGKYQLHSSQNFGVLGPPVGSCEVLVENISSPPGTGNWKTISKFYNQNRQLLGECSFVQGYPGPALFPTITCTNDALLYDPLECDDCLPQGHRFPKYDCQTS